MAQKYIERNSRKIIARLTQEGFVLKGITGDHYIFIKEGHGIIVVPHPKKDLPIGTARNIAKAAGWL